MAAAENVALGDHLDFSNGSTSPVRTAAGRYPVYGSNGVIGYAAEPNSRGPLIVIGRVGSYCGSLRYVKSDAWVTDNALVCRASCPEETRYWYYALHTCGLNRFRAGSGQPVLSQQTLRSASVRAVAAPERPRIAAFLGALDDKIAANDRVVAGAEALMLAVVDRISEYTTLGSLARRSAMSLEPREFDNEVAHYSFAAFDDGVQPYVVDSGTIRSRKFLLAEPCVLFSKLNPRIPRIWNLTDLPSQMALASTEFVVLQPIAVDASTLWSAVRQPDLLAVLQSTVAGMTGSRQRIQPRELLDVAVRDVRRLARDSTRAIGRLGALCGRTRTESARLSAFRDAVLAPLISGNVRVSDVGPMVGDVS